MRHCFSVPPHFAAHPQPSLTGDSLSAVGKELDASPRSQTHVENYFARLAQLTVSKKLPSRMRFLCKDLIELRKNKWQPRREKLEAKTLDEVHADAAAALGIVKPAGQHHVSEEQSLFPEGPNGPDVDGWSVAGKGGKSKSPGAGAAQTAGFSALTGAYVPSSNKAPPTERPKREAAKPKVEEAEAETPAAEAAPAVSAKHKKAAAKLTDEDLAEECKKLLSEYDSAADVKEALLVVQDLETRSTDVSATRNKVRLALDRVRIACSLTHGHFAALADLHIRSAAGD